LKTSEARTAQAELEGHQLLARGEVGPAFDQFAKASAMRPEALARAHLATRNYGFAESVARKAVDQNPEQVPPLAAYVEILQAAGKEKEARAAYARFVPMARWADRDVPVFRRLDGIVARWKADPTWKAPEASPATSGGSDETAINRIDLGTLGPLTWTPYPAEPLAGTGTDGKPWSLASHKGRNVLVLFFLGGKCAHCMQQLQVFGKEFEALKKLGVDTIAVSTDGLEATRTLKNNAEGVKFPMPMIADPKLDSFKRYRAYDDFESQPLHGTFLIDAQGRVRFQRISADPFLDVEFIRAEAARVKRIVKTR
jgi:peroxiredoxin